MRPETVGDHPREERVVRCCHPVGQCLAAMSHCLGRQWWASQSGGGDEFARTRMFLILASLVEYFSASGGTSLACNSGEKPAECGIIGLGPFFKRVMVALRAFDTHTQEDLANTANQFLGVVVNQVKSRRAFAERIALSG